MMQSTLFYLSRVLLFLPATAYGLAMLAGGGNLEFLKWYFVGPLALLAFLIIARQSAPGKDAGPPAARNRGVLIFAFLQFHWLLLLVPIMPAAPYWTGLAALAVILSGILARSARPLPGAGPMLLALGILTGLFLSGGAPFASQSAQVASTPALARLGGEPLTCFWNLFFKTNSCSVAESYPGGVLLTGLLLILLQRQYIFELILAGLLGLLVGLKSGPGAGLITASLSLGVLLAPGRERFSMRGWFLYGGLWLGLLAFFLFAGDFAGGDGFYFQQKGPGNSWLFWMVGFFLSEVALIITRFWKERRLALRS